jgi:hypothetical protein
MMIEIVTIIGAVCLIDQAGLEYCRKDEVVCCHLSGSPPIIMKLSECIALKEERPEASWTRPRADGTCVQH